MKSRTFDDAERYNVLDARDKYIRLKLPPKAAEVRLRGYCPDICPEKEHLFAQVSKSNLAAAKELKKIGRHRFESWKICQRIHHYHENCG